MGFFDGLAEGVASGLFNLAGGFLGAEGAEDINERNIAFQREFAEKSLAFQRELATHGIRYRVEDAKASGVHPLYAIGAPVFAPSPVSVTGGTENPGAHWGAALANMGQDISRSMRATMTSGERVDDIVTKLQVENMGLQNDLLRSQIAKENAQIGPPMPSPMSGAVSGDIDMQPAKITASNPVNVGAEAGGIADISFAMNADGTVSILPSKDAKERIEDMAIPEFFHGIRNLLIPNLSPEKITSAIQHVFPARPGYRWKWIPWKNAAEQVLEVERRPLHDIPPDLEIYVPEYGGRHWRGMRKQ